jgi:hypothetical protein
MMFAIIIESVIMPRFGTGTNGATASPLTADAPWAASSRQAAPPPLAAPTPSPGLIGWMALSRHLCAKVGSSKTPTAGAILKQVTTIGLAGRVAAAFF